MKLTDRVKAAWNSLVGDEKVITPKAQASNEVGQYNVIGGITFTGEKNIGELGALKVYNLGYSELRARSWQLLLDSESVKIISRKYVTWMVGAGLKLQAEPISDVLKDFGANVDAQAFSRKVEQLWKLWAGSKRVSHNKQKTLNHLAAEAFKNAIIGGDVLVVLRYRNKEITVQLIDGDHVVSPLYGTESFPKELPNGHKIINGIEVNEKGEHIAYHVRKGQGYLFETERILAKGSRSGMTMAFMVYGDQYRIDNYRGLPLLAVMFETSKKLERYKDATLGSAEERQKLSYVIEHGVASTGENFLINQTARAMNVEESGEMPEDDNGIQLQNRVAATLNKTVVNLPVDAKITVPDSKQELYFKDFYDKNFDIASASVEMPPNVAMSKYDSNFSASRAALKDWENTLRVGRYFFATDFYQPIYDFFLEVMVLSDMISAPGYLRARVDDNWFVLSAYRNARYVGSPVPHIDPVKEVEAERKKLGPAGAHLPLTTQEAATEALGGGDSESNTEQFTEEWKAAKTFEPVVPDPKKPV